MLDALLAPLRLPTRALEDLEALIEAVRRLPNLGEVVAGRLRSLDDRAGEIAEDVGATRAQLERISGQVDMLAQAMGAIDARVVTLEAGVPRLEDEVARTRRLVEGLKGHLQEVSEHLPDRQRSGPIARAREAITGDE